VRIRVAIVAVATPELLIIRNRRASTLAQQSQMGTIENAPRVLAMQKVDGLTWV
jgi:hypothetical protein